MICVKKIARVCVGGGVGGWGCIYTQHMHMHMCVHVHTISPWDGPGLQGSIMGGADFVSDFDTQWSKI